MPSRARLDQALPTRRPAMMRTAELDQSRQEIEAFVAWVLLFLERLKESGDIVTDEGPLLLPFARGLIRDAWPDFQADFSESGWQQTVRDAEAGPVQAHGLYGTQLALKWWMVHYLLERFLLSVPHTSEQLNVERRFGRAVQASASQQAQTDHNSRAASEKPKGLLKRLIEAIDIPLDSIIAALGLSGSVTEIKKVFGASVDG
jgi:hypothetical protein